MILSILFCDMQKNAKIPENKVNLKNIKIKIIHNNNIVKTWYQNNAANLLRFPGLRENLSITYNRYLLLANG